MAAQPIQTRLTEMQISTMIKEWFYYTNKRANRLSKSDHRRSFQLTHCAFITFKSKQVNKTGRSISTSELTNETS